MNYRGYNIYWDGENWRYNINDEIVNFQEPPICPRCQEKVTIKGHDACLANTPKAKAACCGHGSRDGYILFDNETRIRHEETQNYRKW